jgi:2-polyprenyl-6-methoxyphenol hydroxylase-like FAD-dependent oxidoreductase
MLSTELKWMSQGDIFMKGIGIIGAGIAGLHLGLFLQQHGIPTTLYTDKTAEQLRAGRLPNTVARFADTQARERALGIAHWDFSDYGAFCVHFSLTGDPARSFCGHFSHPASFVDMRMYQAALMEDFRARGGWIVVGALQAGDVADLSEEYDLVVVAAGRGSLAELFPRLPEYSPYTQPQRVLCAGLFHGIRFPDPLGMTYVISPGQGEVFHGPFYSFAGPISNLLIEAVPGSELAVLTRLCYEEDPVAFNTTVLDLLRAHAPPVYERIDPAAFGLTGPLDLLQGAITPVARRGYTQLGNGKYAVAIGDVRALNDPLAGQGANAASYTAWTLGEVICEAAAAGRPFDAAFCRDAEARSWDYLRAVVEWSNAILQPPAPHRLALFTAAAQNPRIADALVDNFNAPQRMWAALASPEGTAAFLRRVEMEAG